MLHHLLSGWRHTLVDASGWDDGDTAASPGPWSRRWLLTMSSLLRFVYLKWINIPQENIQHGGAPTAQATADFVPVSAPALRSHHAFVFRHTVDDFRKSRVYDLEMTENSVLFSEAFAFVSFCKLYEVDYILESGVYKGVSTEMWSVFAKDVIAVDIFLPPEAERRLADVSNVRLLVGDGRRLLPTILEQQPQRRTAIFIDGPKGELAIHMALHLRKFPQVAFVALHDMAPYRKELIRLGACFFSDETWFQDAYGDLDAPFRARPDLVAGGTMAFLPGTAAPAA